MGYVFGTHLFFNCLITLELNEVLPNYSNIQCRLCGRQPDEVDDDNEASMFKKKRREFSPKKYSVKREFY